MYIWTYIYNKMARTDKVKMASTVFTLHSIKPI